MSIICPTILAENPHTYREQLERISGFAGRIQIDLADGEFAPNTTITPVQAYWPNSISADIHLMFKRPVEQIETLISLKPNIVILHAESEGDIKSLMLQLKAVEIQVGIALLKDTRAEDKKTLIDLADHVLIFSGSLGHFGGEADYGLFEKIKAVKKINPDAEIGWDGGVNDKNVADLVAAGVDVLNVGGFIQKATQPQSAYAILESITKQ